MDYRQITSPRQFRSTVGMDRSSFDQLVSACASCYFSKYGKSYEDYVRADIFDSDGVVFQTLSDCIFFVLFQQKNDLVFDSLGAVFGTVGSVAHRYFDRYSALLEETLLKKNDARTKLSNR